MCVVVRTNLRRRHWWHAALRARTRCGSEPCMVTRCRGIAVGHTGFVVVVVVVVDGERLVLVRLSCFSCWCCERGREVKSPNAFVPTAQALGKAREE